jgi:hypothetical protein
MWRVDVDRAARIATAAGGATAADAVDAKLHGLVPRRAISVRSAWRA